MILFLSIVFDAGTRLLILPIITSGNRLVALSAGIGRGHPNYLDAVLSFLPGVPRQTASGWSWQFLRQLYRLGGRGGPLTGIYNRFRRSGAVSASVLSILEHKLRRELRSFPGTVLVDHPLLARLLGPVCRVVYLHGEVAAPESAAIAEAELILVPLEPTARRFEALGISRAKLAVTGLIIEPQLLARAETAFHNRLARYRTDQPLTVAFFTSGAYPRPHMTAICLAARSCLDAGHRMLVFAGTEGRYAPRLPGTMVFSSRAEENEKTAGLFPEIDLMVAAAHERINWALGLGLPMFALLPHIGPFAPENFAFAAEQGVCLPLTQPQKLGSIINTLRHFGRLAEMAQAGWGKLPITGAENAARLVSDCLQ
ncbi:MAG: hypothetical protein N2248_02565 [candidate division WOR-3 bacterium]|uniref:Glycosyltransferase n=1 Tax=candidate division WOR-3 bacterium TaxID=2052148 RepID=A0A7C2APA2_UNCW3|nr:hypothetical protein [candidate division WOR-3 bacterium]